MPSLNRSQLAASESLDYDGLIRTVAETVFNDEGDGYVGSSSDGASPSPWSRFIPTYPTRGPSPPIYCDDASSLDSSDTDDDEIINLILATPPDSSATSRGHIAQASDVESDALPTRLVGDLTKSTIHRSPSQKMPRQYTGATSTPRSVNSGSNRTKEKSSMRITRGAAASPRSASSSLSLQTPLAHTTPVSRSPTSRKRKSRDEPTSGHERPTKRQAMSPEAGYRSPSAQSRSQDPRHSQLNVASLASESPTSALSSNKSPVIHLRREDVQRALHEVLDSDDDAYSYDDPKDQDYTPFDHPPANPRRRQNPYQATSSSSAAWIPKTIPKTNLHQQGKKSTRHGPPQTKSRLKPAKHASTFESAADSQAAFALNGECKECGWKQAKFRLPDFKRHLRSHCRKANEDQGYAFKCTGIPYKRAEEYQVPPTADIQEGDGGASDLRVAACMMTFSRRDALRRHVLSSRTCLPDPSVFPKIRRMYSGECRNVSPQKPRASKKAKH